MEYYPEFFEMLKKLSFWQRVYYGIFKYTFENIDPVFKFENIEFAKNYIRVYDPDDFSYLTTIHICDIGLNKYPNCEKLIISIYKYLNARLEHLKLGVRLNRVAKKYFEKLEKIK